MTQKSPAITELVNFKTVRFPRDYQFPSHLHHFYQLDVILSGEHSLLAEGEPPFHGQAGDGWLIPPLVRHGFASRVPCLLVDFKLHLTPAFWLMVGPRVRRHRFKPFLLEALRGIDRMDDPGSPFAHAEAMAGATLCLLDVLRESPRKHRGGDRLDSFRRSLWPLLERVEKSPHSGWWVSTMADQCHLSPDHFTRCFHQVLGLTAQRYLLETRMRSVANDLIAMPPRPIKKIAEAANYSSVHGFSLAFKKVFRTSPAAYRRARTEL